MLDFEHSRRFIGKGPLLRVSVPIDRPRQFRQLRRLFLFQGMRTVGLAVPTDKCRGLSRQRIGNVAVVSLCDLRQRSFWRIVALGMLAGFVDALDRHLIAIQQILDIIDLQIFFIVEGDDIPRGILDRRDVLRRGRHTGVAGKRGRSLRRLLADLCVRYDPVIRDLRRRVLQIVMDGIGRLLFLWRPLGVERHALGDGR